MTQIKSVHDDNILEQLQEDVADWEENEVASFLKRCRSPWYIPHLGG